MPDQPPNICVHCGEPLKSLGLHWCGTKHLTLWACRGKNGCGKYTFYPAHQFQHTLAAAALRTTPPPPSPEAAAKNNNYK